MIKLFYLWDGYYQFFSSRQDFSSFNERFANGKRNVCRKGAFRVPSLEEWFLPF